MKNWFPLLLLAGWLTLPTLLSAQEDTNKVHAEVIRLLKSLKYQQGEIDLHSGLAKLTVGKDFNYLSPDDTDTVLVKLWGNPPDKEKTLGMIIPKGLTPMSSNCWVVTIDYSEDGYVKDDDASKINYDDLLKTMQKQIADSNAARRKEGYPGITLLGWATPPHYDAATHKLYWAKNLKFDGETGNTLNYNIRMLGRRGVLELNAIANTEQLPDIEAQATNILAMIDFNEGHRYVDFDPKKGDKVAKYGIAALVAGGVLAAGAKLGLFKLFWVGLIAAKKFIIIGLIACAGFIKKIFKRRES